MPAYALTRLDNLAGNHDYTFENNLVWSSSGSIFQVSGKVDEGTFKRVDGNVYFNPRGAYS